MQLLEEASVTEMHGGDPAQATIEFATIFHTNESGNTIVTLRDLI